MAETLLRFVDGRQNPTAIWACKTIVGMPIRTQKFAHVSPARAAEIAADVATRASSAVMHSRPSWLRVAFCTSLQNEMNSEFADSYKGLGARAYIR